jgi:hypothetical protein
VAQRAAQQGVQVASPGGQICGWFARLRSITSFHRWTVRVGMITIGPAGGRASQPSRQRCVPEGKRRTCPQKHFQMKLTSEKNGSGQAGVTGPSY